MHFNSSTTNTTSDAGGFLSEGHGDSFTWQNPVFRMPSPRGPSSGSTRIPGTVMSHRPRWTPEKHARILAQIKATRTDIDPSFPRETPVPADAPQTSAHSVVKGAIDGVTQTTLSYIHAFTDYAFHLLYPAAGHASGGQSAAPSGQRIDWHWPPARQQEVFFDLLIQAGMSKEMATDTQLAWTAAGIPFIDQTWPTYNRPTLNFPPGNIRESGVSKALVAEFTSPEGGQYLYKCYPRAGGVDLRLLHEMTGIDPRMPRLEMRCLLASHIAHELLHWDVTPKLTLGMGGGQACLVAPVVRGSTLLKRLQNNLSLNELWQKSMRDDVIWMDMWKDKVTPRFREDYIRIHLLSMLIGDYDRAPGQYIVTGKQPDTVQAVDWDTAFGPKVRDDRIFMHPQTRTMVALWPDAIPKHICDEFGLLKQDQLIEAARAFGLTGEEVEALISRFEVVTKKLAGIKKT